MELTCSSAKRHFNALLDGQLRGLSRTRVVAHLRRCAGCASDYEHLSAVRTKLRSLPQPNVPGRLSAALRVMASRERTLVIEDGGSPLNALWRRWKFRTNQFMRPLALPATGGLLSTLVLFATLVLTIGTTTREVAYEVPVAYYPLRAETNLIPVELRQQSVTLTMNLDGMGRMKDFAVTDGTKASFAGDSSQHANVSISSFSRILGVAEPISGNIQISFQPLAYRQ
jgi:hypothetical protein